MRGRLPANRPDQLVFPASVSPPSRVSPTRKEPRLVSRRPIASRFTRSVAPAQRQCRAGRQQQPFPPSPADRRQIEATVLPDFPDLDQNSARPAALEPRAAFEQGVRTLYGFHTEDKGLLHDNSLTHIQAAQGTGDLDPREQYPVARRDPAARDSACRRAQAGRLHILDGDHRKPKRSSSSATARSRPSSPSDFIATRATKSGRFRVGADLSEGRPANPATMTMSLTPSSRARFSKYDAAPIRTTSCGAAKRPDDRVPFEREDEKGPARPFARLDGRAPVYLRRRQ